MKRLIIFGNGGHSKVVKDMAETCGYEVTGFIAPDGGATHLGCRVYACVEDIPDADSFCYFIARGDNRFRKDVSERYRHLEFINIIHPTAIVSRYARMGVGNLLMPYTVINAYAEIGDQNIINTSAIVEHDCKVGSFCHISVKSAITGTVTLGDGVFLGAGSTVRNGKSIGEWTTVGVGSSVVKDLQPYCVYVGCPARLLREDKEK